MADEWKEEGGSSSYQSPVDSGRGFGRGRGRGMAASRTESYGGGYGSNENNNGSNDDNRSSGYGRGDGDSRGRGRGRGGHSGGGGGGRNDDDEGGYRPRRNENGEGGRPGGGAGADGDVPEKPREIYIPPEPTEDEGEMFSAGITSGINFDKYENIPIKATGENIPPPIARFDEAGLRKFVLDNVTKSGYTKPTPVQKNALPIIMAGRDIISVAQTGSGKTAAFLIPIINVLLEHPRELILTAEQCQPHVIIVSPTRELTLQIFNEARKFSHGSTVRAVVAYGGTASYYQANQVKRGCHILVATPGRLNDFVQRGLISYASVRFVVLDEADRMLDMGFLPDMERMMGHETMVKKTERQTCMFSATFPSDIQHLADQFLSNYIFLAVGIVGASCEDIQQRVYSVSKFEKRPKLVELLREEGTNISRTMVFVEMKRTADFLAAFLSENDFPTTSIHGDRLQREREEALLDFKTGRMPVLVATAVAARGLDIKEVAHVVNYDMPKGVDEYVHRIGRTGRVGNKGKATSFYDPESDTGIARDLVRNLKQAHQEIPDWLEQDGSNNPSSGGASRFGGRDVRRFDQEGGGGGGGGAASDHVEAVEEDW